MNPLPTRLAVVLSLFGLTSEVAGQSPGVETITLNRPLLQDFAGGIFEAPVTSPDGKYIAYRMDPGDGALVTRIRPNGTRDEGLTVPFLVRVHEMWIALLSLFSIQDANLPGFDSSSSNETRTVLPHGASLIAHLVSSVREGSEPSDRCKISELDDARN